MQILNITNYITALHDYLAHSFEHYGLAFHADKDPASGENTNKPEIYDYLMPATALNDGYPARCPCIVITVDSQAADNTYSLALHTCVCYAAVANNEKVHQVNGEINRYEYGTEGGYDTNADVELYKSSLLLTEFVHDALCKATALNVRNISVELPAPDLQDFPYCISTVRFDTQLNFIKAGQNAYHDYY